MYVDLGNTGKYSFSHLIEAVSETSRGEKNFISLAMGISYGFAQ